MQTRVLVLGATGMLGSVVYQTLKRVPSLVVRGTARHPMGELSPLTVPSLLGAARTLLTDDLLPFDYVINCIALLKGDCQPQSPESTERAFAVNADFPRQLAEHVGSKGPRIIHVSTNGVFSGTSGPYDEDAPPDATDLYGRSKLQGEIRAPQVLNIRSSIIGTESGRSARSLLEWVRTRPRHTTVPGYTNHRWNGVTTHQFAAVCRALVTSSAWGHARLEAGTVHLVGPTTTSKYELICAINELYNCELEVVPVAAESPSDATLSTRYRTLAAHVPQQNLRTSIAALATAVPPTD